MAVFLDDGLDAGAVSGLALFLLTGEDADAPLLAWALLDAGGAGPLAGIGATVEAAAVGVAGAVVGGAVGIGAEEVGAEGGATAVGEVDVGAVVSAASGMSVAGASSPTCPPSPAAAAEATC